jgi:hypothetical protein
MERNFQRTERERMSLKCLHKKVEIQLGFKGMTSVRKLIHELGFHW